MAFVFRVLVALSHAVALAKGYTWLTQTVFTTSTCASNSVSSVLMLEMNKCYQTSSTTSTLSVCSSTCRDKPLSR